MCCASPPHGHCEVPEHSGRKESGQARRGGQTWLPDPQQARGGGLPGKAVGLRPHEAGGVSWPPGRVCLPGPALCLRVACPGPARSWCSVERPSCPLRPGALLQAWMLVRGPAAGLAAAPARPLFASVPPREQGPLPQAAHTLAISCPLLPRFGAPPWHWLISGCTAGLAPGRRAPLRAYARCPALSCAVSLAAAQQARVKQLTFLACVTFFGTYQRLLHLLYWIAAELLVALCACVEPGDCRQVPGSSGQEGPQARQEWRQGAQGLARAPSASCLPGKPAGSSGEMVMLHASACPEERQELEQLMKHREQEEKRAALHSS